MRKQQTENDKKDKNPIIFTTILTMYIYMYMGHCGFTRNVVPTLKGRYTRIWKCTFVSILEFSRSMSLHYNLRKWRKLYKKKIKKKKKLFF